jgi:acyl-CoA synthetase (AMP-forming)/AMP-acid ligase II
LNDPGLPASNIAALFEQAATRRRGAAAILAPDGRVLWTFDGLAEAAGRLAGGLVHLGIGAEDRVLILEPHARRLYPLVVGVIWAGAAAMLPAASISLPAALSIAGRHQPRAVIASLPAWAVALTVPALRGAPIRLTSGPGRLPGSAAIGSLGRHSPISPRRVPPSAPAVVSFTTGSTGPARAVHRSHEVLAAQHRALAAMRSLDEGDRDFAGLAMLTLHDLGSGMASAPAPRGAASASYGHRVREAMVRTRATAAAGFPHLFESAVRGASHGELGEVRSIQIGGSRVRAELLRALHAVAPAAQVTIVYGSTEVEPISSIDAREYLARLEASVPSDGVCVGAVVDGLELRVDPAGVAVGSGAGRILVRGARASAPPGTDGWVETGDIGRVDGDGRLWLLGRSANRLGGVPPLEVERSVEVLPWVARAAVIGAEAGTGRRGLLVVQPRDWAGAHDRAEWQAEVEALAADRRWPVEHAFLLRRLPAVAGASRKVDEDQLRRLWA